jgi:hypothetical protein
MSLISYSPDLFGLLCCCAAEVFLGQPYNEKADTFSFGVVLYGEHTHQLHNHPAHTPQHGSQPSMVVNQAW